MSKDKSHPSTYSLISPVEEEILRKFVQENPAYEEHLIEIVFSILHQIVETARTHNYPKTAFAVNVVSNLFTSIMTLMAPEEAAVTLSNLLGYWEQTGLIPKKQ